MPRRASSRSRPRIRCASAPDRWRKPSKLSGGGPMRLTHEPLSLETAFEFRISVGASSAHANTLVRIEHDGITGLGEASPSHYYGENQRLVEAALETWAPHLGEDPF